MDRKRMILLMAAAVLMMIAMTAGAVFAGSKEPDLTDVTGIRFELASPVELEQWVDGILDDDSRAFYYEYVKDKIYKDGSTLILVKSDGSESRYVLDNNKKAFIGEDGTSIKRNALYISEDHDYDAEWKIDGSTFKGWNVGDHIVTLKYQNFICDVTVTVVENSIDKVEFIKHDPLIENYNGHWTTDAEENKYYLYNCNFGAQDLLRVTMKGGAVKEYTHKEGDEEEDDDLGTQYIFRAKDGESVGLWYYQMGSSNQLENHWTLGSDNYAILYYGGKEYQFQVTIVGSPIDSISYKPAVPITYRENVYLEQRWDAKTQSSYYVYGDPKRRNGDKLTVVKNGKKKVYTYSSNKYAYINGKDRIDAWDIEIDTYQKEKPWVLGSDNEVEFNYLGRTCRVKVTVQKDKVKNPVKVSGKTVKVKYTKVRKKTQKIWDSEAFSVVDNEGKVTYKLTKKDKKAKNKITVSKDGTVTVKKGLKKGKYTIKVNAKAAGNEAYAPISKTVTVKVNVK